jgi:lipopolysaccharide/colanic/teichoic acid biosynthesis glycosyltransferase
MSDNTIRSAEMGGLRDVEGLEGSLWARDDSSDQESMSKRMGRNVAPTPVGLDPAGQAPPQVDILAGCVFCFGLIAAIIGPAAMCSWGILMSPQTDQVMVDTAYATILTLVLSLVTVRRILTFPLLRSITYIVLTFAAVSLSAGALLKLFQVHFSSPQLYISTAMSVAVVEAFLILRRRRARPIFAVLPSVDDPTIGNLALVRRAICQTLTRVPPDISRYNAIIADFRHDIAPEWERLLALAALRGIPVFHVKQFREMLSGRVAVDHLWENTVVGSLPALVYPQLKRLVDLVSSIVLLPLVLPVIVLAGIAIRLESTGPVIFSQLRTGYGGRKFRIYKLRSMTADAPRTGTAFTQQSDPRVTRVGALMRQYRIDELPQIFNIILGDMSWIGPRPEAVELASWYEREIPFYAYRHIVRPGITGWAQVNQGNVAEIDAARIKLEYDFFYIKHFSFWLDAIIVVKTIRTILTRSGAR